MSRDTSSNLTLRPLLGRGLHLTCAASLVGLLALAASVTSAAHAAQTPPPQREPAAPDPRTEIRPDAPADHQPAEEAPDVRPAHEQPQYKDLAVTEHEIETVDGAVRFRATAGLLDMNDEAGRTRGTMFFVYYAALDDDGDPLHRSEVRPVTYIFNGGPGAASVWLHLGTAGPWRVPLDGEGHPPAPPHRALVNEHSWLPATDLVFIDPIGTGFSRPAVRVDERGQVRDDGELFYGVAQDVQWVGEFIRLHATRFERWADPKFLAGESYGTTRAAQLASSLQSRFGFDVSGVILISAVLDFATIREAENNLLPFVTFLPTYTATAHYHGKLGGDDNGRELEDLLADAERFAIDEYLPALAAGGALDESRRHDIARRYADLTGLPVEFVLQNDLRVGPFRFMKRLLNDDRLVVGRMDGRITGHDPDPAGSSTGYDPSLAGYIGVYAGAFNDLVRAKLQFESDEAYEVLSRRTRPWQPREQPAYSGGYLNVADDLRRAMTVVPEMRVLVASGWYDLATPFFAADYTVNQMRLPERLRANVEQTYYRGGHMMYHNMEDLDKVGRDVREFITRTARGGDEE